jgi:heme-degrading monooxygenase HmoA
MTENTFTTVNFYQIEGAWLRFLAFMLMGISKFRKVKSEGMLIGKLLGTGSGLGFSRKPNWGQYALLCVWTNEKAAKHFFESNFFHERFKKLANKEIIFEMQPFESRGIWDGKNPFPIIPLQAASEGQVAILTCAKFKLRHIPSFWKHVDPVNKSLKSAKGRIFSVGMGEWLSRPITFSVWENIEQAKAFAYAQGFHSEAIKRARDGGWFKEDLFVRFTIEKFQL